MATDLSCAALALARRFAEGATLWCWSPASPHHAQHVAVEFVHPVIVGKRALPAEAVEGLDALDVLRALVAAGDVLVVVAPADDPRIASVLRRAAAWGLATIWMGSGMRPQAGAADHVLWLEADDLEGAHGGGLVLLYHLLWELTHVCFEHPGLLSTPDAACTEEVCVTCSDAARLGEVVSTAGADLVTVRTATGSESIDATLVGPLRPGDLVLIHAGTAIERLDEP